MKQKQIELVSAGQEIVGDIFIPENPRGGVLIIHGSSPAGREYGARKNYVQRAKIITDAGFTVLIFDMRGYGDSEGNLEELSIADHLSDCVVAYDFLAEITGEVGVFGGSYGGYLGILLTEKRDVKSLVLQSPAIYEDNIFAQKGKYKQQSLEYRRNGDFTGTRAIVALEKYENPLYIIGSENDKSVPKRVLDSYFESACSDEKKYDIIKGANHTIVEPDITKKLFDMMSKWYQNIAE